jgi:hypothetical protein
VLQEGWVAHGRRFDGAHGVGCKALLDVVVLEVGVGYRRGINLLPFARALS